MKLSEKALEYLVLENDRSLLYHSVLVEKLKGTAQFISLSNNKKLFTMHKEIEAFLEEVETKDDAK